MLLLLAMMSCSGKDGNNFNRLEPELQLPVEQINFDEVVADKQELTANFTIANVGRGDLVFESVEFTDGTPAVYTMIDLPDPFELSPNEEFNLEVTYIPDQTIQHLGGIKLVSNDPDRPEVTVSITGYGIAPIIEVEPQTLWFGEVDPGDSINLKVDIEARGEGKLKVYEIFFEDAAMEEVFTIVKNEAMEEMSQENPLTIAAGGSHNFDVKFAPTDGEPWDGELLIRSNDPNSETESVRLLGNTDYTGEEPPTVQILTPNYGTFLLEDEEVLLEGSIVDDADPPNSMVGTFWFEVDGNTREYIGVCPIDETGYCSTTTDLLPAGDPVTLTLEASDSQGSIGKDTRDVTVWAEDEPVPYVISGGSSLFDYWSVDDDITIYLDGTPIFSDTDHTQSSHPPFEFEALKGQEIRIVVTDVNSCDVSIDALTLHWGTSERQDLNDARCDSSCDTHSCYDGTYRGPWPSIYLDETYTINIP